MGLAARRLRCRTRIGTRRGASRRGVSTNGRARRAPAARPRSRSEERLGPRPVPQRRPRGRSRVAALLATVTRGGGDKPITLARLRCGDPFGDVAQLARAPALQAGGRGFESHRLHRQLPGHRGAVDSLVGLAMSPSTTAITESLPAEKQGVASALNDTVREVGSALGRGGALGRGRGALRRRSADLMPAHRPRSTGVG